MSVWDRVFSLFTDLLELRRDISAWALLVVNIFVAAGAVAFAWPVGQIVLVFWFESVIIGCLNVLKMLVNGLLAGDQELQVRLLVTGFFSGFFVIHYGGFVAIHLLFIFVVFSPELRQVVRPRNLEAFLWGGGFSVLVLVMSHVLSFYRNFWRGEEYRGENLTSLMLRPYGRVAVVHLFIFIGGALMHQAITPLIAWFALKILLDLLMHRWERSSARRGRSR